MIKDKNPNISLPPVDSSSELELQRALLKKSPVFNFSLGSKELFHSNFIAWLAEKYPKQTGQLFSKFLKNQSGDVSITRTERESQNRDICLFFTNGQELVIENKVKSLPNQEQLKFYSKDASANQSFLLLTLVEPSFDLPDGWAKLTYADLAGLMESYYLNLGDSYDIYIIKDYIFVISALSNIFQGMTVKPDDKFNFYSVNMDDTYRVLSDLRMGDVYQKLKYQMLAVEICKKLRNTFPDAEIFFEDTINRFKDASPEKAKDKDRKEGAYYLLSGMSRSQGMMEVAYVLKKGLFLTVQIQGDHYRQMVQGYAGYGKGARQVAEALLKQKLWFNFNHIGDSPKEYPTGDKMFNKYGETDFYRSVLLTYDFTVGQITGFVIDNVKMIKDKLSQIKNQV